MVRRQGNVRLWLGARAPLPFVFVALFGAIGLTGTPGAAGAPAGAGEPVTALSPPAAAQALQKPASASAAGDGYRESDFLGRIRRVTYEGRRAGEGYFSPDGTKIIVQSEREPGNPFYQMYVIDLTTGDSWRISPGIGKTTCGFFHPLTGEILYASTHHDPAAIHKQEEELRLRASGRERRYAWDYDPEMEIYVHDPDTGEDRRLTWARGYDAEGSYSPDGQWIVFASNRRAYERPLSEDEQQRLQVDPAYFADIWIMRADGSDPRQLTDVPGYDGGPFFFPDGSRIVWRRFEESGLIADIWTMRPDGSDARRVTDFGAMSWAPYVHPSGKYIFFASNKLGFDNFEIFIVDVEGRKEPVRVTYTPGFDGLPVPSPDGRRLAWTSQRHGDKGGQLFLAEWNHERALEALAAAPPRVPHAAANDSEGQRGRR